MLGWSLVLGVVAIAGLPPFGIFMSEFLVVSSTFARAPLLAMLLVFGLARRVRRAVAAAQRLAFGEPRGSTAPVKASYVPIVRASRRLVLVAGHLSAAAAGRLVPARLEAAGMRRRMRHSAILIAKEHRSRRTGPGRAPSSMPTTWRLAAGSCATAD